MSKNWLKYVVGIALILNVLTLVFFLMRKPPPPPRNPEDILVAALHLDAEQQKKFALLREQHRDLRFSLLEQIKATRLMQYKGGFTDTDSTTAQIGRIYTALERSNVKHFNDLRALCRPDQLAQFDSLMVEAVETMTNRMRKKHLIE
jgi:periplasmic protein CpxP/Spy